jgi:hypothetical protein
MGEGGRAPSLAFAFDPQDRREEEEEVKMADPRNPYLVGVKGSDSDPAPLEQFIAEVGEVEGADPKPTRDSRYATVQLTDQEAAAFREKYRDSLLIEPDAPLQIMKP